MSEQESKPSMAELWDRAGEDAESYRSLCRQFGYLISKESPEAPTPDFENEHGAVFIAGNCLDIDLATGRSMRLLIEPGADLSADDFSVCIDIAERLAEEHR